MKTQLSAYGYPFVLSFRFKICSQIFICKLILKDESSVLGSYTLYIYNESMPPCISLTEIRYVPGCYKNLRAHVKYVVSNYYREFFE